MELSKEFEEAKKLIINDEIQKAKEIIESSNRKNLNFEELNILGTLYFKEKKYLDSQKIFLKILETNKNFLPALLNLGVLEQQLDNYESSLQYFKRVLNLDSKSWQALNNIGFLYNKQKEYKKAIASLEKSISLNPSYADSNYNIGKSFFYIEDFNNAERFLKKSLELRKNFVDPYYYLGEIFRIKKLYKESLDYFVKSRHKWTTIRVLECLLLLNMNDLYNDQINKLNSLDPENRRISAATSYFTAQYEIKNEYNFCKNPIDYVLKFNLLNDFKNKNLNLADLYNEIKDQETLWEFPSRTTVNGITTKKNLSLLNLNFYSKFQEIILEKLNDYKNNFNNSEELIIKNWPGKFFINSWSNTLKKEGYNITHIHPSGWISGVFYLNVPENLKDNEGGIEFSLHGYDFINNKKALNNSTHIPKVGELILFPSSLFHKTIPFNSNGERVCIAFDYCKVK